MANGELLTERLLSLIDEGRRTATYKLALLLALMDIVAADPGVERIPTRVIASEVLARYVTQTRSFTTGDGAVHDLRQITMKGSPPLRAAQELRAFGDGAGCRTIGEIRQRLPDEYTHAVGVVEDTFVRYPIPLLQVVGSTLVPFLYEPDWPEQTSASSLRKSGHDMVRLLPGVADRLVVLGPLLRPLVELHWARDVARWNSIATEDEHLRAHLFGADRTSFPPPKLRDGLADIQGNACFYCGDRLAARREVDHFLAWSRWPNDAVENLVLADRCNSAKSDHLAAAGHLARLRDRRDRHAEDLVQLGVDARWTSDPQRTNGLITSTYAHVAAGTPLWVHGSGFDLATGPIHFDTVG
jgi:hypothetical protein